VMIGVVGIQLSLDSTEAIAKALPFWGPQRLIQHAIDGSVTVAAAVPAAIAYGAALLALAAYATSRR
jgi:hypothetical protein